MILFLLPIFLLEEEEPPRRAPFTELEQFQQKIRLEAQGAAYFQNLQEEILPQIRAALASFTRAPSISKLFRLRALLQELQRSLEQNSEYNTAGNAYEISPKLLALVRSILADLPSWFTLWYWRRNGANPSRLLYEFQDLERYAKGYKGKTFIS